VLPAIPAVFANSDDTFVRDSDSVINSAGGSPKALNVVLPMVPAVSPTVAVF